MPRHPSSLQQKVFLPSHLQSLPLSGLHIFASPYHLHASLTSPSETRNRFSVRVFQSLFPWCSVGSWNVLLRQLEQNKGPSVTETETREWTHRQNDCSVFFSIQPAVTEHHTSFSRFWGLGHLGSRCQKVQCLMRTCLLVHRQPSSPCAFTGQKEWGRELPGASFIRSGHPIPWPNHLPEAPPSGTSCWMWGLNLRILGHLALPPY